MKVLCEMLGCEDPVIQVGVDTIYPIDSLQSCETCWEEYENLRAYRPGDHETWVEHSVMERDGKCHCMKGKEEVESSWHHLVENIYGDAWSIRYDAIHGNEDDLRTNLNLKLSKLLLKVTDAMTLNTELSRREEEDNL